MASSINQSSTSSSINSTGIEFEKISDSLARGGHFLMEENAKDFAGRSSIYISERISRVPGFGTASTLLVFKRSMELAYGGRFHNFADLSSHLFHLYMGMVPVDSQRAYVPFKWGMRGESALEEFDKLIYDDHPEEERHIKVLKEMLTEIRSQNKKPEDPPIHITTRMVEKAGKEFEELQKKTHSYLAGEFIPEIISILERCPPEARPSTKLLGGVKMFLSDEGLARWTKAVETHSPFVPFKRLEHLHRYMSPEQLKRLHEIFDVREKTRGSKLPSTLSNTSILV